MHVLNIKNHEKIEVMKLAYLIFDKNSNISDGEFANNGFSWDFETDPQQTNDFNIQMGQKGRIRKILAFAKKLWNQIHTYM